MKNLLKGALLNALVFPGTGQLAQKKKRRGWVYIILALICIGILMRFIIIQLAQVTDLVAASNVPLNAAELTNTITENMATTGGLAPVAVGGFALIWLIALVDGIVTGLRMDRTGSS